MVRGSRTLIFLVVLAACDSSGDGDTGSGGEGASESSDEGGDGEETDSEVADETGAEGNDESGETDDGNDEDGGDTGGSDASESGDPQDSDDEGPGDDGETDSGESGSEASAEASSEDGTEGDDLLTVEDILPIFSDQCGCHDETMPAAKLDLLTDPRSALLSRSGQVGMDLVRTGDPQMSYLVHKIRSTHGDVEGGKGDRMPPGLEDPLSEADIVLIETWIEQGAN